jgi:hypothetical protein
MTLLLVQIASYFRWFDEVNNGINHAIMVLVGAIIILYSGYALYTEGKHIHKEKLYHKVLIMNKHSKTK